VSVDPRLTFAEFVSTLRSQYVRAQVHQRYPDSLVRQELAASGVEDVSPAINFVKRNATQTGGSGKLDGLGSFRIAPPPISAATARDFPSHFLTVVDNGDELYCGISYLDVLYKRTTYAGLLKRLACILERASQTPDTQLTVLLQ